MTKKAYEEMIILHKAKAPLYDIQNKLQENLKIARLAHMVVDMIQEWSTKYLNAPEMLDRKGRVEDETNRVETNIHMQVYYQLKNHIDNTVSSYMKLHYGLEALVRMHKMPSIGASRELKHKDSIRKALKEILDVIIHAAAQDKLEVTKEIIL